MKRTPNQGSANGMAQLDEESVKKIRYLYETKNVKQAALAQDYGVCQSLISLIVLRKLWKHV